MSLAWFLITAALLAAMSVVVHGATLTFGGQIGRIIRCANGLWFSVGSPKPATLMLSPGSRVYPMGIFRTGVWAKGLASPGGSCSCPNGNCQATSIPAQGTIIMVGTGG
jgi:hypothetical protein